MITEAGLTLSWSTVLGSGVVVSVVFLALVERLRRTFATQADVGRLGERVAELQRGQVELRETVVEARDRAADAQREQRSQGERLGAQVLRPLERITEKLEAVGETQAAHATVLEHVLQRLDRIEAAPQREGGRVRR